MVAHLDAHVSARACVRARVDATTTARESRWSSRRGRERGARRGVDVDMTFSVWSGCSGRGAEIKLVSSRRRLIISSA